jgi:hypothetical protein
MDIIVIRESLLRKRFRVTRYWPPDAMPTATPSAYASFLQRTDWPAYLAARAVEVGDCLERTGRYGCGSTAHVPTVKTRAAGAAVNLAVPKLVWLHDHGDIPAGRIVYRHCCNTRCVRCLRLGRHGDQLRRRKALGLAAHMQSTRSAITRSARSRSTTRYCAEQAQAVRDLAVHGVPDVLIEFATDVGLAMVRDIRSGRAWSDCAPAASVFAWRPGV